MSPSEEIDPRLQLSELANNLAVLTRDLEQALYDHARVGKLGEQADASAALIRKLCGSTIAPDCLYDLVAGSPEQKQIEAIHRRVKNLWADVHDVCRQIRGLLSGLSLDDPRAKDALKIVAESPLGSLVDVKAIIAVITRLVQPRGQISGEAPGAGVITSTDVVVADRTPGIQHRERGCNLDLSRKRLALLDQLQRELATIHGDTKRFTTLVQLKTRYPDFELWNILSAQEQKELLTAEFKPRAYARRLVLRSYGLTSPESLKMDRKKLRKAG